MSRINYSKWDHIEISDDEDDTHPNIDTPSLFRWRHQARLEREAQWNEENKTFQKGYSTFLAKIEKTKSSLKTAEEENKGEEAGRLRDQLKALTEEEKEWIEKKAELEKQARLKPWNVDTICQEGKSKTIINKAALSSSQPAPLSEEEQVDKLRNFMKENETLIRKFGMFKRADDSMNFLLEHTNLVCEETANRLVLWCVDLAVEEKISLMEHVSHQCIIMQFMLELAKSLKIDPRAVIRPFFAKFRSPEPEYQAAFNDELSAFRARVRKRAEERIAEAVAELEQEEKTKRLGPGGLDPVEVFDTLPKEMQECFEKKDLSLLQEVVSKMNYKDAKYHMDRCIGSGLWVPGPNDGGDDEEEEADGSEAKSGEGDDVNKEQEGGDTAASGASPDHTEEDGKSSEKPPVGQENKNEYDLD